jgi:nucleoside-diphosphate-sugar epimerase
MDGQRNRRDAGKNRHAGAREAASAEGVHRILAMSSPWAGQAVLVTGAGGFIGSHLVDRLVTEGAETRAFLHYNSRGDVGALGWESDLDAVDLRFGDLRDEDALAEAARGCDTILHLGALIAIPYSYLAPRDVVETNVLGTLSVLGAARRAGAGRVVCMSTSEVYGTPEGDVITERDRLRAQSPYAASKIGADQLALSFHRSFGTPVGVVRPFNTYGPRQSARAVIPTILSQGLVGGELSLGALHPVRDFLYVEDTVSGVLEFAAWDGAPGSLLHIGTGEGVSVEELVRLAGEVLGRELDVRVDERRVRPDESEVQRLVCDPSAARERLGWRPDVSLREGLARTAEWIERNLQRYRPDVYAV